MEHLAGVVPAKAAPRGGRGRRRNLTWRHQRAEPRDFSRAGDVTHQLWWLSGATERPEAEVRLLRLKQKTSWRVWPSGAPVWLLWL